MSATYLSSRPYCHPPIVWLVVFNNILYGVCATCARRDAMTRQATCLYGGCTMTYQLPTTLVSQRYYAARGTIQPCFKAVRTIQRTVCRKSSRGKKVVSDCAASVFCVCVCGCVFMTLHSKAQSGPVVRSVSRCTRTCSPPVEGINDGHCHESFR